MTADNETTRILRCWSCEHYRISGCKKGNSRWPDALLDDCPDASYDPGTSPVEFGSAAEYRLHAKQRGR